MQDDLKRWRKLNKQMDTVTEPQVEAGIVAEMSEIEDRYRHLPADQLPTCWRGLW